MEKAINVIEDWLSDCNSNDDPEHLHTYIENDQERLTNAIFTIFDEKTRCPEVFENVLRQLFILARSKDERLREFVILFAPNLIYLYLSAVSTGDKKSVGNVEVALLTLYNVEVLDENGKPRVASFRLPSLARESIYHEPSSLAPASYTTESLHRLEALDQETVRWGPPKQMTSVTAATRNHLATAILVAFNARLARLPKIALMHLCRASSKIVCQGFTRPGHHQRSSYGSDSSFNVYPRPIPRIPVTSDLMAELLHAVYFAIHNTPKVGACPAHVSSCTGVGCYHSPKVRLRRFNEFASLGIQALEDIHMRAQYELFSDVLLMSNAIKNSLRVNPSGQPSDGPMGISIALTPSSHTTSLSKSFITNASFRTKKLPEDIPIQRTEGAHEGPPKGLGSISEDTEGEDRDKDASKPIRPPQGSGREGKDKLKLPSNHPLTNLVKKRDKEKLKNGDRREGERKEKDRKSKEKEKDKENRNEAGSNRNSSALNSDSDGGTVSGPDSAGIRQSPQSFQPESQNQLEMKPLAKLGPIHDLSLGLNSSKHNSTDARYEDAGDGLRNSLEVNGSQNHVSKIL